MSGPYLPSTDYSKWRACGDGDSGRAYGHLATRMSPQGLFVMHCLFSSAYNFISKEDVCLVQTTLLTISVQFPKLDRPIEVGPRLSPTL